MRCSYAKLGLLVVVCFVTSCGDVPTHKSVPLVFPDVGLGEIVVTLTVGPDGGTIQAGPVEMEVPVGAVEEKMTVTVEETDEHPPGNIGPVYMIETGGIELSQAVTISIAVDKGDVPPPYDYEELKLAHVHEGHWRVLAESHTDMARAVVTGATDHLSVWGVVPKVKIDMLWIVDNSASMCQEQWELSQNIDQFVEKIQTDLANLDVRLAVTTTDAIVRAGKFANSPATNFPPACFQSVTYPCLGDEDCTKKYGDGWECKGYSAKDMFNLNGSINSNCIFRCENDAACCKEFCFQDECGQDMSCLEEMCISSPTPGCTHECRQPGQGISGSGCLRPPSTADCPAALPKVLAAANIDLFKCLAIVEPEQSYQANIEQGMKAAWLALDPEGPNSEQSLGFLRDDAFLLLVFVTDEDDCSIHADYCSPNYVCESDDDCPKGTTCRVDSYYSENKQKKISLCCGTIKKDYYNVCSLLGDYKGSEHHSCAYDLSCEDCVTDDDCDEGWYCKQGKKCRPYIYSFTNIASYQSPPGTPIHCLKPAMEYYSLFASLKPDPNRVMVAAVIGEAVVLPDDAESLISDECLADEKLKACSSYLAVKWAATAECLADPAGEGCEELYEAKRKCVHHCYLASKGNAQSPTVAKNSYVCESPNRGKADLGSRFIQLADAFGPNGLVVNICSQEGMDMAKDRIADMIIENILF